MSFKNKGTNQTTESVSADEESVNPFEFPTEVQDCTIEELRRISKETLFTNFTNADINESTNAYS